MNPLNSNIRFAHFSELAQIAHICTAAFWDDALFGDLIHPHRHDFPADYDLYWLRRCQVSWWDYRQRFVVSTTTDSEGKETVTGVAQWERLGPGGKDMECWWFDPRNLAKPLATLSTRVASRIRPNRAADPAHEDVVERAYPHFQHVWSDSRAESWYLETLAVHPAHQGRGHGRALVQWGLDRAEREGVSASLVCSPGNERFYARCGFDVDVGSAGMGDGNPLRDMRPAAPILFRDASGEIGGSGGIRATSRCR